MSTLMMVLTSVSLAVLLTISVYRVIKFKNRLRFVIQLFVIGTCFGLLYFFFYARSRPIPQGNESNDFYFVIVLYIFMLLGMLAQYGYIHFTQPKGKRKEFDLGLFVAPVFASPIIFIPLLAAMQNADIDLKNLTTMRMMVFFVAFENGFFWKEYCDNRRKEKEDNAPEK